MDLLYTLRTSMSLKTTYGFNEHKDLFKLSIHILEWQ
jgi:hypothetical protein